VSEIDAPESVEPIECVLLTSESVHSFEDASRYVDWYGCRWVIEEWHKVEKTGCRLEASQLKNAEAIKCLAALTAVVAVRMLQLRDLARAGKEDSESSPANQPSASQAVVPWTWLVVVAHLGKCRPEELTPRVFWQSIARRGGFVGRRSDGAPGWQTIWRGWYDIMTMVEGIEISRGQSGPETYG
jgi:hypothetical protein